MAPNSQVCGMEHILFTEKLRKFLRIIAAGQPGHVPILMLSLMGLRNPDVNRDMGKIIRRETGRTGAGARSIFRGVCGSPRGGCRIDHVH